MGTTMGSGIVLPAHVPLVIKRLTSGSRSIGELSSPWIRGESIMSYLVYFVFAIAAISVATGEEVLR
jgi:hypothetical protein